MGLALAGLSLSLCCWAGLSGCDSSSSPATGAATSSSATTTARTPPPPAASGSSTASSRPAAAQAGEWRGNYRAARATVAVPKGSPDRTWADDDGSTATGDGSIELRIDADGMVTGTAKGALGPLSVKGMFDGASLRAGLAPADPAQDLAMSGVLWGAIKGKRIAAELRVSSHDASLVRAATLQLERR